MPNLAVSPCNLGKKYVGLHRSSITALEGTQGMHYYIRCFA